MNLLSFYDPNIEISYVHDKILWDRLFTNPFPKDIKNINKGSVTLSNYFEVQLTFIDTGRGYKKERKHLYPKSIFFNTDEYQRNTVFTVLCNFLTRYKRPYRDFHLMLPLKPDIAGDDSYMPMPIYSETPMYPEINEENNLLILHVTSESYEEFSSSVDYGNLQTVNADGTYTLMYPFNHFLGFLLDH